MSVRFSFSFLFLLLPITASVAGEADVVGVEVKDRGHGLLEFDVTVSHADEGWEHYADKWEIDAPDGTVLAARTLYHPHTDEQPFTRNLVGVKIPDGIEEVVVRAHDSVHGFGGKTMTVEIP